MPSHVGIKRGLTVKPTPSSLLNADGLFERDRLLPRLIDLGLDVLHPIQKYAMDETRIAGRFGGQLTFWAGFDVQQTIPFGTVDEVRREVRHLFDTYYRPEGRLLFTLGNGITGDTPIPSLEALFEEAFTYGRDIVRRGGQ